MKTLKYNLKIQIINLIIEKKPQYKISHSPVKFADYLSKSAANSCSLKELFNTKMKFPLFLTTFDSSAKNLFLHNIVFKTYALVFFQSSYIIDFLNFHNNENLGKSFLFNNSFFFLFFNQVLHN